VSLPAHGTLSGVAPALQYTPGANYFGADSFSFKASDGVADSNQATVTLTVNGLPTARADTATTKKNKAVSIAVLANDSDKDGGILTVVSVSESTAGTAVIVAPGSTVKFTPKAGFSGLATFAYTLGDGQGANASATVNVTVSAK
jgi:large repetitive protein